MSFQVTNLDCPHAQGFEFIWHSENFQNGPGEPPIAWIVRLSAKCKICHERFRWTGPTRKLAQSLLEIRLDQEGASESSFYRRLLKHQHWFLQPVVSEDGFEIEIPMAPLHMMTTVESGSDECDGVSWLYHWLDLSSKKN